MTFWIFDGAFAAPDSAVPMEDSDAEWRDALGDVEVCAPTDKVRSPAICGGEFAPGTTSKEESFENLIASHGAVLDVDVWEKPGRAPVTPFTADDLRARLSGFRFIAWKTFSSTAALPKWRVVVPFATPMPPQKYQALWTILNDVLDDTMAENTKNPARLGFFRTTNSEAAREDYEWFVAPGEPLDWSQFELTDAEAPLARALKPADLSRSPDWSTDDAAKEKAKRYYRKVGTDVEVGSRHETLLRASCKLWWDWAAPSEQWVFDVLNVINENFVEPKAEEELWKEVRAGYARVLGENRIEQPTLYGAEREPEVRATRTGIAEHGKGLARQGREEDRIKGRALKAMAAGECFAEPIEARKVALDCATELAALYGREKPERLLDLIRGSLEAQRDRSPTHPIPTDEELLSRIRWKQKELRTRLDEREKLRNDDQRRLILRAFNGTRDMPYSSKEYRDFEAFGFSDDQWILQAGKDYYFFVGGEYRGPYDKATAENFARVFLAPAEGRIKINYVDKNGNVRPRKLDELTQAHGTFVESVERCSYATKSSFSERDKKLIMPIRMRPLEPEYSPEVARWLELLGGQQHDQLLQWLAAVPATDRELSALLLTTPKNQGKGLLAAGVGRIWREAGPIALEEYSNDLFEETPLVFVDEVFPRSWAAKPAAMLRAFLSTKSRVVKKPYVTKYTSTGYPRMIIAANDMSFWKSEDLYKASKAAVADRFLVLDRRGSVEAGEYLASLGEGHRLFVNADKIAKHVLHLHETIALPTKRFVTDTISEEQGDQVLFSGSQKHMLLFDWLVNYITQEAHSGDAVVVDDRNPGDIYINAGALLKMWGNYDKRGTAPSSIGPSIKACCRPERRRWRQKGRQVWYRPLKMAMFLEWLDEAADLDIDDFSEALVKFAKKKAVRLGSSFTIAPGGEAGDGDSDADEAEAADAPGTVQ